MTLFLVSGYLMGLFGSLHCVGMCGPISIAIPKSKNPTKHFLNLINYHLGRIFTYGLLGLIFGLIGHTVQLFVLQQYFSIGMGILLLVIILFQLFSKKANPTGKLYLRFNSIVQTTMSKLFKSNHPIRVLGLGLMNGLLPCAMSFTAIIASMGMGNIRSSILFMIIFGLGTVPLLLIFNYFIGHLKPKGQVLRKKLIPILGILMAVLFIVRGLNLNIKYLSPTLEYKNGKLVECEH